MIFEIGGGVCEVLVMEGIGSISEVSEVSTVDDGVLAVSVSDGLIVVLIIAR